MAFNTENKELVVILSNGQIMFCHEKYCRFHSAVDMIPILMWMHMIFGAVSVVNR